MEASLSDAALVARCRTGDENAWAELVNRFSRYVFAIATQGFGLRADDAEDVFQEVFARTYQHLDRLRDDASIRPWIAQLTRRLSIDKIRAGEQRDKNLALLDDLCEVMADGSLCAMGGLTPMPVRSALRHLADDLVGSNEGTMR